MSPTSARESSARAHHRGCDIGLRKGSDCAEALKEAKGPVEGADENQIVIVAFDRDENIIGQKTSRSTERTHVSNKGGKEEGDKLQID